MMKCPRCNKEFDGLGTICDGCFKKYQKSFWGVVGE